MELVRRDIGAGCGEAALQVVKSMTKWQPAKVAEKVVRSQLSLPLTFTLTDKEK